MLRTLITFGWAPDKICYDAAVDSMLSLPVVLFLIANHGDTLKNELTIQDLSKLLDKPLLQAFPDAEGDCSTSTPKAAWLQCLLSQSALMIYYLTA